MRRAQTEPVIAINIKPRDEWINLIDFVIENVGLGPAYDINFNFDKDLQIRKNKTLKDISIFQNGINYMSPGQKIQFFFTSLIENFDEKVKTPVNVTVTYRDSLDSKIKSNFVIDFSQFLGMSQLGKPPLYEIKSLLAKLQQDVHYIMSGLRKLKVDIYTKEDREELRRQIEEEEGYSQSEDKK